jgi:very-short-patch-repair endonuclease/predicted transcriptional regulator of viral defense system
MAIETRIGSEIQTKSSSRAIEAAVAALAARQHGVVSRGELLDVGLGAGAIKHRIAPGRLQPLRRGVYALGHREVRTEAWWMAAVLAAGSGTVLAGRSAAALWAMRQSRRAFVEVISPRRIDIRGIDARCIALPDDEVTVEDGIPVTTPARTLFDLAAVVPVHHLEAAFNEAEYRRLTSPVSLDALLARYPGRRGTPAIRRVLENHRRNGETRTRSELERELVALVDASDLPPPLINRNGPEGELDARWPEHRLVVEVDGFAAHGTRKAFEEDRARDRALTVAGWRVVRITWRQLTTEPDEIARQLATLLADRRG